jgi:hypothetical protein
MAARKAEAPKPKNIYPAPQGTHAAVRALFMTLAELACKGARADQLHATAHQLRAELLAVKGPVTVPKLSLRAEP